MDQEEILKKWQEEIKRYFNQLHPKVRERRERVKQKVQKMAIWLGGPGQNHPLYHLRELIKEILKREKFEVVFSEEFLGGADLASKEIEEVEALDIIILLSITPGASAEAIEFAYLSHIRHKLWIYLPEEYKSGYVYRSLFGRHRLIAEDSLFSLKKFEQHDPELAIKVINRAIEHRLRKYRRERMNEGFGT
jgi:hypothetical protein